MEKDTKTHHYIGKDLEAMSFARNYHNWILSEIKPYVKGVVGEVGAGVGSFSQLLLTCPIESLSSFEPSEKMHQNLKQTLAGVSHARAVNDFFSLDHRGDGFDCIVYINVLEHIEDDRAELEAVFQALKPGGVLVAFVPALPWLFSNLDREVGHFRRYLKKELEVKARESGFSISHSRYFDIAGILPWYVTFVLMGRSIGKGSVSAYDKIVVPIMRVVERVLPVPIGKNVLLVARKK